MENNTILEVKNVSVLIKDRFLVKNANFSLQKGECWGIIGTDHSGKTSLIKVISGSLPITEGQIIIDGTDLESNPKILQKVGICLDPPVFFKYQTVYDNMKYLAMLSGIDDKERIIKVLNKFNLAHKMKTRVFFLSYFEKKLMALALAFLIEPVLLLLDEPFKSLPPEQVNDIRKYIKEIREKGTAIMISSQNLESIEYECDKFIFMEARKIKDILSYDDCEKYSKNITYAFVKVKYPHYTGKLLMENFNLSVKILDKRVLFEAEENETAEIVRFLTKNKINIYKAGYLNHKSEKILANLTPYFKEDDEQ